MRMLDCVSEVLSVRTDMEIAAKTPLEHVAAAVQEDEKKSRGRAVTASRKLTRGLPLSVATLYSRFIRSRYTSRCSSPIPEMIVSPDSESVCTRKVGSSFVKRPSALLKLACVRDCAHNGLK